ncbi:MAG TPA: site-specific integrase, partial [Ktedonosporobacter sp.]|nr:site-specific integrase [Ktedonosporobacter sp.]
EHDQYQMDRMIPLVVATGLRHGEVVALKWSDIDFERRTLTVKKNGQLVKGHGMVAGPPKTRSSVRTIVLLDLAIEALHRQRSALLAQRPKAGASWQEQDYVFPSRTGNMLWPTQIDRPFKSACKRWGLPAMPFHTLRKAAGSLYIVQTGNELGASRFLGHSNPTITRNIYRKLFADEIEQDREVMNAAFRKSSLQSSLRLGNGEK